MTSLVCVNCIFPSSIYVIAISHRQFHLLLEDMVAEYGDLILHSDVRWLSKGKVLHCFLSLLPHIKQIEREKTEIP